MVHPPLTSPSSLQEKMASVEDAFIELHLDQWMMEVTRAFPNKHIPALVLNSTGKTVCVTRFIRPIPPPELVAGEKTTPEMVARFVSLIPVIPNYQFFPGQMDIWLTAQEILDRCASEIPCRATLLACLLKYFFERTYLLVGTGVPGGPSAFVLTFPAAGSKGGSPTIWDPSTSQKHAPGDPFSPLSSLHAIIDHTNIWVNLQKEELISQMNLDVSKRSSDWWPAFGRAVAAPTPSVQPEALEMKETPENEVKLLQDRLEKILRNAIMKLRSANRTIWNRYCTASLRKLLPGLEMNTWSAETTSPPDHIQELEHISSSYKMCGFPINLPYTGSSALVEAVKSTGVHLNDAPEMEFSAAVYVRSFPSNILSVWIYVASLIRVR